jgi:DHA1 family bicyclomycin/chloramphenicol resistance-like MFS transporter
LGGVEVDLFIPSFPELQKIFHLTPFMVQLTLSVNFVAYCICSLFAGALGDRYDRRTVALVSLVIFVLGSALCVLAFNYPVLLLGRFLQGVGMAAPAILGYVIIADEYPIEKQPALLGLLNGTVTLAMVFAPVMGSYTNLYFNWRGNFVILFLLGISCLITSYIAIPSRKGDLQISLSPIAYLPLFLSKKLMILVIGLCLLSASYWLFIGMAPILYMEGMSVNLKHFGYYYQGALAAVFSIVSLISPNILKRYGLKLCLYTGIIICTIHAFIMLVISFMQVNNPFIITSVMAILAAAVVFPFNILYPMSLNMVENTKARTAALINSARLLFTAIALEGVSYFYVGKFLPIGLSIFITTFVSMLCIKYTIYRRWVQL